MISCIMLYPASEPGKMHLALISEKAKSVFKADLWEVESWLGLRRLRNSRLPVVLTSGGRRARFILDLQGRQNIIQG